MKTITFLITDTHFGVRQASSTWFKYQSEFIYKQFIPLLKQYIGKYRIQLIHLGDVFDSRSSIPVMIATEIRKIFRQLSDIVDELYIIAGNHDMYSPASDEYCSLEPILGDLNVRLIVRDILEIDNKVLIPWAIQEKEGISELSKRYKGKIIFTHSDIVLNKPVLYTPVFSGHVHIPLIDHKYRFNLGSCYALNFGDSNQERGVYSIIDDDINTLSFIPNKYSIKFYRIYNEHITDNKSWDRIKGHDYIELYINRERLLEASFNDFLQSKRNKYKNLWVIPQIETNTSESHIDLNYNIDHIIQQEIPEQLKDKFNFIKKRILDNAS